MKLKCKLAVKVNAANLECNFVLNCQTVGRVFFWIWQQQLKKDKFLLHATYNTDVFLAMHLCVQLHH